MVNVSTTQLVRYLVGFVFIVSALMKIVGEGLGGYFTNLGFPSPITFMYVVAITEIIFGLLILLNRYVKLSTIPLMVVIIGALVITKLPMLHEGIIHTLFHARLDIVMLGLLFLLYQQYDGKFFRP
ncbi:DoxX family protein [Aquisalibacillus elongatus]|uniref:Putative membrane protein YphA (DoxX/SURF4 family) n=1 Tax=Aquisalibacillus elongatus TaxID=485577 RepID=A0A3N5BUI3_9BACI|nr:DoxX family protein [Aquisalibacillus elongatus]RPF51052.1 putative membrane protein YphA (DoxX/SURF4 family) [Aquisalibacillus elongatus]